MNDNFWPVLSQFGFFGALLTRTGWRCSCWLAEESRAGYPRAAHKLGGLFLISPGNPILPAPPSSSPPRWACAGELSAINRKKVTHGKSKEKQEKSLPRNAWPAACRGNPLALRLGDLSLPGADFAVEQRPIRLRRRGRQLGGLVAGLGITLRPGKERRSAMTRKPCPVLPRSPGHQPGRDPAGLSGLAAGLLFPASCALTPLI